MMKTSVIVSLAIGLMSGCGKPPSKPFNSSAKPFQSNSDGQVAGPDGNVIDPGQGIPMTASLAAFQEKVYNPILGPYCSVGCHVHNDTFAPAQGAPAAEGEAPSAPASIDKAHAQFLLRTNFNAWAGADLTVPVVKMDPKNGGGHNCWESEVKKCYDAMFAAIEAWRVALEDSGFKPTPVKYPNATQPVALSTAQPFTVTTDPGDYVIGSVETATVAGAFTKLTDAPDGPIKTYATTPMGTAAANAANLGQSILFNMNVTKTGVYHAWARVYTPAAGATRFFFSPTGVVAGATQFNPPVTTDAWKWVRISAANDVPVPYNLTASATPVPMRIFLRDPRARINTLVLTSRLNDFNGEAISNQFYDVRVPLTVPGVENAAIIATVWEATTGDGKKSLGVKELKIDSPVPLHVKNIKPLINGLFYTNHGTYTIVDTVAGGPNPVIQTGGANSSIWIADKGLDSLSFSFEVLEVAP